MTDTPWGLPASALNGVVDHSASDLEQWRQARILVTGGTGFVGSWFVASLLWADQKLKLGLRLQLLTRTPSIVPLTPSDCLQVVEGDILQLPHLEPFDILIHGAAVSSAANGDGGDHPLRMASTIIDGTRAVLERAQTTHARVLFLSSGAVYGRQSVDSVAEDTRLAPDPLDPVSAYGEAKRLAETWCANMTRDREISAVIARLFSFVGPRLPLDQHFAVGNFLADVRANRPIRVMSDGRAVRSYLYASDLAEWLLAILSRGTPGQAYNVGSPEAVTIRDLAQRTAQLAKPALSVQILGSPGEGPPDRYLPDVSLAKTQLGLSARVGLNEGLRRSLDWLIH